MKLEHFESAIKPPPGLNFGEPAQTRPPGPKNIKSDAQYGHLKGKGKGNKKLLKKNAQQSVNTVTKTQKGKGKEKSKGESKGKGKSKGKIPKK